MAANADPEAASQESTRPTARVIYERVREDARDELEREPSQLAFSALFAGFTIGATPLAVALTLAALETGAEEFVAALVYPTGFIAVILGRAQLFTENTMYPVVLSLSDRSAIPRTARLWAIVFAGNVAGGALFALLAVDTAALPAAAVGELNGLGEKAVDGSFGKILWAGVVAGWLLALVAWLVEAAETAIGQFFVIWLLTLLIGLGDFSHCVATTLEVLAALFDGAVGFGDAAGWLGVATLGNVLGGVVIVSLLNYGQVRRGAGG